MNEWVKAPEEPIAWGFAFVGGFGDAAGFVLAKAFTGHVTGNLVMAAISAAALNGPTTVARLSAVACFLAGTLLSVGLAWSLSSRQASTSFMTVTIAVEALLILGAYWAFGHQTFAGAGLFITLLSLALGLQNGAVRRAGALSVHTTALTGMITGLTLAEAERIRSPQSAPGTPAADPRVRVVGGMLVLFFVGAGAGAALAYHFSAAGVLWVLPVLALLGFANAQTARHPHTGRGTP